MHSPPDYYRTSASKIPSALAIEPIKWSFIISNSFASQAVFQNIHLHQKPFSANFKRRNRKWENFKMNFYSSRVPAIYDELGRINFIQIFSVFPSLFPSDGVKSCVLKIYHARVSCTTVFSYFLTWFISPILSFHL